jgi:hypothetical protein
MTKCPNCGTEQVPIMLCPRCHDVGPADACGVVDRPPHAFPPPREVTEEAAQQIVEESMRARREFKVLTAPMEGIADQPQPQPGAGDPVRRLLDLGQSMEPCICGQDPYSAEFLGGPWLASVLYRGEYVQRYGATPDEAARAVLDELGIKESIGG